MSSFERGPLAFPTPEEEKRMALLAHRAEMDSDRNKFLFELAEVDELAEKFGVDLSNDYDPRTQNPSYAALRAHLLARKMMIGERLEESEELAKTIREALGEKSEA
jgi:hypothetical protein